MHTMGAAIRFPENREMWKGGGEGYSCSKGACCKRGDLPQTPVRGGEGEHHPSTQGLNPGRNLGDLHTKQGTGPQQTCAPREERSGQRVQAGSLPCVERTSILGGVCQTRRGHEQQKLPAWGRVRKAKPTVSPAALAQELCVLPTLHPLSQH